MDFLIKQQSIVLNANCQLIQCTHIYDLLSNLKRLQDSMIIKVFNCNAKCLMSTDVPKSSNIHQLFLGTQLHMCNNNYIAIYTQRTLLDMNISYFPNQHYWFPLLENLGHASSVASNTVKRLFVHIIFSRNFMPQTSKFST